MGHIKRVGREGEAPQCPYEVLTIIRYPNYNPKILGKPK